ncbi:MAG: CRISPR-associated endoribonuclease Cas6 [Chitinophagaceae bacterium]|nr:MAG: CRISPR-associated endoribonuclease Cas6 [Chitinophagaceae bacterium]
MIFNIKLHRNKESSKVLPINYQYPLSAAIYKILSKGDAGYAQFLHEEGYGKGYKFFTFSDLKMKYERVDDRLHILEDTAELKVHFQLPEASRTFVEGLFKSEEIVIADKKSKVSFQVQSVISLASPLNDIKHDNEIVQLMVRPDSIIVTGIKQENGNYAFKNPDDAEFIPSLIYSWRNKIAAAYNQDIAENAILLIEIEPYKNPFRSRLITIKADTKETTKIRGYNNFKLRLTAEKRFIELVLNAGLGLYSAQGMGCLEGVKKLSF